MSVCLLRFVVIIVAVTANFLTTLLFPVNCCYLNLLSLLFVPAIPLSCNGTGGRMSGTCRVSVGALPFLNHATPIDRTFLLLLLLGVLSKIIQLSGE